MAEEHDKSYRLLFSFPRMVEDLIRLFIGGAWVERLDFTTLTKVSERDVSPELVRREKDLLWRLRIRPRNGPPEVGKASTGDWLYVYLHLEFQSSPDQFMALRALTYRALLWEDLSRNQAFATSGKLPPILSVVLYNGTKTWTAPTSVDDLLEDLTDLPEGANLTTYRLIDERRWPSTELIAEASPVMGLFRMEQSRAPETLAGEARKTAQGLAGPENVGLREALGTWLASSALPRLTRNLELPLKLDLMEIPSMLEERVIEWTEQWKQEGLEEGRREGRQLGRREGRQEGRREGRQEGRREGRREGRKEGEKSLLERQLKLKYGTLPEWVSRRLDSASAEQLLEWGGRLLTAPTLEAVFAD